MTPYQFGRYIKQAVDAAPVVASKQPMEQAIATTAKTVPAMLDMARAADKNVIDILNPLSHSVYTRTGRHPNNWEINEILAQGLPDPAPAKAKPVAAVPAAKPKPDPWGGWGK